MRYVLLVLCVVLAGCARTQAMTPPSLLDVGLQVSDVLLWVW